MTLLVACRECDLLHRLAPLPPGGEARCTRCGADLCRRGAAGADDRALALALTACVLFVIANVFPLVGLEMRGNQSSATLLGTVQALRNDEARGVAALVFITAWLVPAAELAGLTWILLVLRRPGRTPGAVAALHFVERIKPWSMVEVFVLGVLVSLVKLTQVAIVEPGVALFSFGALMLFIAAAAASFDTDAAWLRIESAA